MMLQKSENAVITRKGDLKKRLIRYKWMYPMLLPGIIILFIFSYMPLYGLLMAFQDFDIVSGISGSPWVGLDNFRQIFASPGFLKVLRNSLLISFYRLLWGFPAPIVLALMLNELPSKKFRKISQTAIYLPHFISWVVLVGIVQTFLSPSGGLINVVLEAMGKPSIAFLQKPEYFRTIIVATDVWKETGWGTIMYLAALQGINQELYEATKIDGANAWQRIKTVTVPQIWPMMALYLVKQIIGIFQIMQEPLLMTGGGPNNASVSLALSAYRYAFVYFKPQNALAVGTITFMILIMLTFLYVGMNKKMES